MIEKYILLVFIIYALHLLGTGVKSSFVKYSARFVLFMIVGVVLIRVTT